MRILLDDGRTLVLEPKLAVRDEHEQFESLVENLIDERYYAEQEA